MNISKSKYKHRYFPERENKLVSLSVCGLRGITGTWERTDWLIATPVLRRRPMAGSGWKCAILKWATHSREQLPAPRGISLRWVVLLRVWFSWEVASVPGQKLVASQQSQTRWLGLRVPQRFSACETGAGASLGVSSFPTNSRRLRKNQKHFASGDDSGAKIREKRTTMTKKPESKWSLSVGLSQESMNHHRGSRVTTKKYLWGSVVQRLIIQT